MRAAALINEPPSRSSLAGVAAACSQGAGELPAGHASAVPSLAGSVGELHAAVGADTIPESCHQFEADQPPRVLATLGVGSSGWWPSMVPRCPQPS